MENLLIKAAKGNDFHAGYDDALSIYCKDFDDNRLQVLLGTISEYCNELDIISVHTISEVLKNSKARNLLKEFINLAKLILVMPAINSTFERSFSFLKLIKSYLRATMNQSKFNGLKSQLDQIEIASTSVDKNEGQRCTF